ncbi:MAG: T9SS type A sorting domain-containing protein [Candidatus Kapaibacterium sp.]
MPICLFIDPKDGPETIKLPTMTGFETVFEASRIQEDIACAQNRWNCICGKQNTPCDQGCGITLKWSMDVRDFDSPSYLAQANSAWTYPPGGPCTYKCWLSDIVLNNSDSWRGKKIDGYYAKSFCQNDNDYYLREPKKGYNTYNICTVLMHEIGHILGLNHFDIYHCNNPNPDLDPTSFSRMRSFMTANNKVQELTDYDKCAVAKLHCPSVTPVEEYFDKTLETSIYPNPSQNAVTIEFNVKSNQEFVSIDLYNNLGMKVLNILDKSKFNYGRHNINIHTDKLLSGNYYYSISIGPSFEIKPLIIIK